MNDVSTIVKSFILCDATNTPFPENAPKNALLGSSLHEIKKLSSSSHSVSKMVHIDQIGFFKKCDSNYPPLLAQIEAATSASYRLVRGEFAAKVVPVVDDHTGQTTGSFSYAYVPFKHINDVELTDENLLESGLIDELVARYFREEDDLHPGNLGATKEAKIVGIDFDMSFYPLTSKIKGARLTSGTLSPTPEEAFKITIRDLENFPCICDQVPGYWPTNKNTLRPFKQGAFFAALNKNKAVCSQVWQCFIKEVKTPPESHIRVFQDSFGKSDEAVAMLMTLSNHIHARHKELENVLSQSNAFKQYLIEKNEVDIPLSFRKKCFVHIVLAEEIKRWIVSQESPSSLIELVKETDHEYTPTYSYINPRSLVSKRGPCIEYLINMLKEAKNGKEYYSYIVNFFSSGNWNLAGYITYASANVILIEKIAKAAIKATKNEQVDYEDLNNVSRLIEEKQWCVKEHAGEIAKVLKQMG